MGYLFRLWRLVLLLLVVMAFSCQKEEPFITQTYDVAAFNKINTGEHVHVVVTQRSVQHIEAFGKGLQQLEVYVANNELFVLAPEHTLPPITVNISVPELSALVYRQNSTLTFPEGFTVEGNFRIDGRNDAHLVMEGSFNVAHLNVDLRDNAILTMDDLRTDRLYMLERNNSHCYISGTANKTQLNLFNKARFNMDDANLAMPIAGPLVAQEYYVEVRGESQAWVHATSTLGVEGYGNCQVYYKGNPPILIQNLHEGATLTSKEY